MNASSFAEEVLDFFKETIARSPRRDMTFESITLEDNDGDFDLVALFHHVDYPGCLFGYYYNRIYSYALKAYSLGRAKRGGQQGVIRDRASDLVADFIMNIEEEVYAGNGDLPRDCDPDSVTWLNRRPYVPNSP